MSAAVSDFVHPTLDEPVTSVAGHYVMTAERRLDDTEREILYLVGYAVVDSACCGVGGVSYAIVPGWIVEWHCSTSPEGRCISRVEPIVDPATQDRVRRIIEQREQVQQVRFG
jgi:hypothetical protein